MKYLLYSVSRTGTRDLKMSKTIFLAETWSLMKETGMQTIHYSLQ